jgi:hypothetical protein
MDDIFHGNKKMNWNTPDRKEPHLCFKWRERGTLSVSSKSRGLGAFHLLTFLVVRPSLLSSSSSYLYFLFFLYIYLWGKEELEDAATF